MFYNVSRGPRVEAEKRESFTVERFIESGSGILKGLRSALLELQQD